MTPPSNPPPRRLNNRHLLLALMVASGWRQTDIARHLGYHPNRVSIILGSPLMKSHVLALQKDLREGHIDDVLTKLARETGNSVDALVALRDHAENPSVQLGAASKLLDKGLDVLAPPVTMPSQPLFGEEVLQALVEVMAEDEGLPPPRRIVRAPGRVVAKTIEEALEGHGDG